MAVTEARADVGLGFYKIALKEKMSSLCSTEGNEDNCSEILSEPKEKGCCVPRQSCYKWRHAGRRPGRQTKRWRNMIYSVWSCFHLSYQDRISCGKCWPHTHWAPFPKHWDFRNTPPYHSVFIILEIIINYNCHEGQKKQCCVNLKEVVTNLK